MEMFKSIFQSWNTYWNPQLNPVPGGPIKNDPFFGTGPRKERVMVATEEELRASKIPKEDWDFCAEELLELERCKIDNFPYMWKCKAASHDVSMCYLDEMKEYEREHRLIQREHRLRKRAESSSE